VNITKAAEKEEFVDIVLTPDRFLFLGRLENEKEKSREQPFRGKGEGGHWREESFGMKVWVESFGVRQEES